MPHLLQKGGRNKHHSAERHLRWAGTLRVRPHGFPNAPQARLAELLLTQLGDSLTGAEVARAVELRKDALMQQNAPHTTRSSSAKRHAGGEQVLASPKV